MCFSHVKEALEEEAFILLHIDYSTVKVFAYPSYGLGQSAESAMMCRPLSKGPTVASARA